MESAPLSLMRAELICPDCYRAFPEGETCCPFCRRPFQKATPIAGHVFISHAAADGEMARRICLATEKKGVRCWIAPRDVRAGDDYGAALLDAIAGSSAMVLVLSPNSNRSSQVRREVERAASKDITIVPFMIEKVELSKSLEFFISSHHWLDATNGPLEEHIQKLADSVDELVRVHSTGAQQKEELNSSAGVDAASLEHASSTPNVAASEREVRKPADSAGSPSAVPPLPSPAIALSVRVGGKELRFGYDPVDDRKIFIGRDPNCDIVLAEDNAVSLNHAAIIFSTGREWTVVDLGATGGTFLNGRAVSGPAVLHRDDVIGVGHSLIAVLGIGDEIRGVDGGSGKHFTRPRLMTNLWRLLVKRPRHQD